MSQATRSPRVAAHARAAGQGTLTVLPLLDAAVLAVAVLLAPVSWPLATGYAVAVLLLLAAAGQHRLRICLRLGDELSRLAGCAAGPVLVAAPLAVLVPSTVDLPPILLPAPGPGAAGGRSLLLAPLCAGLLLVGRAAGYTALRVARRRGRLRDTTVLVGAGTLGVRVAELIDEHPELGLSLIGFLDVQEPVDGPALLPVLGAPDALPGIVRTYRVRRVLVCFPLQSDTELVPVLRQIRHVDVCVVPRLYELGAAVPTGCLDEIWGIRLLPLRRPAPLGPGLKRAFDLAVGGLLLVVLAPLLLGLSVAVRLGDRGPAFFRQTRLSGPRRIRVLKLRSVAHRPGHDSGHDADTAWTVPADRHTPIGSLLRATHLDELPQLVNVLRGEMSLVGPRPERPFFAAAFTEDIPRYADRHRMPGGMTGWAQVHGLHGDTSIEDRARFDNQYIEYWSPWLDLVILTRTLASLARAGGAGPGRDRPGPR